MKLQASAIWFIVRLIIWIAKALAQMDPNDVQNPVNGD